MITMLRAGNSNVVNITVSRLHCNLDNKTAEQVYQVILKLNQTKATSFILVTHDEVLANRMNQVYHLENGCLVG